MASALEKELLWRMYGEMQGMAVHADGKAQSILLVASILMMAVNYVRGPGGLGGFLVFSSFILLLSSVAVSIAALIARLPGGAGRNLTVFSSYKMGREEVMERLREYVVDEDVYLEDLVDELSALAAIVERKYWLVNIAFALLLVATLTIAAAMFIKI